MQTGQSQLIGGRCRKVRDRACCGTRVAKREKFFGWRLHRICTMGGASVACTT